MRGETIGATVRRLRLLRAADPSRIRTCPSGRLLSAPATAAPTRSRAPFARPMARPPADYRATGSHAAFKAAAEAEDHEGFPVAIETLPATRCASVAHKGAYFRIDQAMGRLFIALAAQKYHGAGSSDARRLLR